MKKLVVGILMSAAVMTANVQPVFAYPSPVAVITNYDSVAGTISIQRANGEPDGAEALLYPGDQITGSVGNVQINCGPYADFYSTGSAYVISYNPPSGFWQVANKVITTVSDFWNNVETVVTGASRGAGSEYDLRPMPGYDVTILKNENVNFSWDSEGASNFSIIDSNGGTVFEQNVSGKDSISINPSALGLNPDSKYEWKVDNDYQKYKFSILNGEAETQLKAKLSEIEVAFPSKEKCVLEKAKYLQLISDIYPEQVDFYWLSGQMLNAASMTSEKNQQEKTLLLSKCKQHLDNEMQ